MAGNGRVFVSHAHVDNALCDRYVSALRARGLNVWYDRQDMQAGHALTEVIERELQGRSTFVVILTPASVSSYWVQMEIAAFRDLVSRDRSRLILPVRAGECDVPLLLRGLKWVDAVQLGFDAAVAELAKALGAPVGPADLSSAPAQPRIAPALAKPEVAASDPVFTKPETIAKVRTSTRVVDAAGNGDYRTITDAVNAATPGERILVRAGIYRETVIIHKYLELCGDGHRDDVIIVSDGIEPTLRATTAGLGCMRFANLTIRHNGRRLDSSTGLWLQIPDTCEVENCIISAAGWGIRTGVGGPYIVRSCRIMDCNTVGLDISVEQATVEDNQIVGTDGVSGLNVFGSQAIVRCNRVSGYRYAISIEIGGGGVFEDNDLRRNGQAWYIAAQAGTVTRARNLE